MHLYYWIPSSLGLPIDSNAPSIRCPAVYKERMIPVVVFIALYDASVS